MISVVTYGRNDGHGYNLAKRAAISFNCMAELLNDPDDEILFVDCNSEEDYARSRGEHLLLATQTRITELLPTGLSLCKWVIAGYSWQGQVQRIWHSLRAVFGSRASPRKAIDLVWEPSTRSLLRA